MSRGSQEKRRTGQLSGVQIMFAAILAIGLILGLNFTSLVSAGQPLQQLHSQVNTEIERLEQDQASLIRERDFVQSDSYVESWARDEGKMVRPGEVLVIPVPSQALVETTPEAQPVSPAVTVPAQPGNWELWWALFFDTAPPDLGS